MTDAFGAPRRSPRSGFSGRGATRRRRITATSAGAEPTLLLQRRLVDEHAETVDGAGPDRGGGLQPRRAQRVVDEVDDDLPGGSSAGSHGRSSSAGVDGHDPHADVRGVDDDVGAS